jgi:hypothetical protein
VAGGFHVDLEGAELGAEAVAVRGVREIERSGRHAVLVRTVLDHH